MDTIEKIAAALGVEAKDLFLFASDKNDDLKNTLLTQIAGKTQKFLLKIIEMIKLMET